MTAVGMPLPPVDANLGAAPAPGQGWRSTGLPLLRPEEEPILGFWIEAGVLASAQLNDATGLAGQVSLVDPPSRAALEKTRSLGEQSLERMTRSNIRLVYYWVARSWTGRDTGGLDVEDLAGAGIEGLIHAIWMWDYRRGLKFSTYASNWIRQSLDRAVIRARGLRPNGVETQRLSDLFRVRAVLELRLGRTATTRELASALEVTIGAVRDLLLLERNVRFTLRLDQPIANEASTTMGDQLPSPAPAPDQVVEDAELHDELSAALRQLSPRERAVVMARVGWGGPVLSEEEVAARFGVTPEQVRSTTQGALTRLRGLIGEQPLQSEAA